MLSLQVLTPARELSGADDLALIVLDIAFVNITYLKGSLLDRSFSSSAATFIFGSWQEAKEILPKHFYRDIFTGSKDASRVERSRQVPQDGRSPTDEGSLLPRWTFAAAWRENVFLTCFASPKDKEV